MRLERIRLKSVGVFSDFEVDLRDYPNAALIAITGRVGEGKTTLLEVFGCGSIYRRTPTRGSLTSLATARDSFVEATVSTGRTYTLRHLLDGVAKKSEAIVLDENGKSLLDSAKVTAFDDLAKKLFMSEDVLLSSLFMPQESRGFLGAERSARTGVLLRTMGMEKLEDLAVRAGEHKREAKAQLETEQARLDDARERMGDIDALRRAVAQAQSDLQAAEAELVACKAAMEAADTEASEIKAHEAGLADKRAQHDKAKADLRAADAKRTALDARLAEIRAGLADAGNTRAEAAQVESLRVERSELEALVKARDEAMAEKRRLAERQRDLAHAVSTKREHWQGLVRRLDACNALLGRAEEIREAARKFDALGVAIAEADALNAQAGAELTALEGSESRLRAQCKDLAEELARLREDTVDQPGVEAAVAAVPEARKALDLAIAEAETLRAKRIGGVEDRVQDLRTSLRSIADGDVLPMSTALGALEHDDAVVLESQEFPRELARAEAAERAARLAWAAIDMQAARKPAMDRTAARLAEVETKLAEAQEAAKTANVALGEERKNRALALAEANVLRGEQRSLSDVVTEVGKLDVAEARHDEIGPQVEQAKAELDKLSAEFDALPEPAPIPEDLAPRLWDVETSLAAAEAAAGKLADLARLEGVLAEVGPQAEAARAEESRLELALLDLPSLATRLATLDPVGARLALDAQERAVVAAHQAVAVTGQTLELSESQRDLVSVICQNRDKLEADLADWTRLSQDLGKDGIQASLVDSAVPELITLTNDLLWAAFGPRFSIDIRTQRLAATGKRQLEALDIVVSDSTTGQERMAETYSGGERTIIGEALSLALTTLACRQLGVVRPTIVRDESSAACDVLTAREYVQMLRRARDLIGAQHILLVSHQVEVQDLCDERINVSEIKAQRALLEAAQ